MASQAVAQKTDPIKWHFSAVQVGDKKAKLILTANLAEGWHVYSQFMDDGGPMPTAFTFLPSDKYSLEGKVTEESTPIKKYDSVFMMGIVCYKNTVVFSQLVELNVPATTIKGKVAFMCCTNFTCLPPEEIEFTVEVKAEKRENNKGK